VRSNAASPRDAFFSPSLLATLSPFDLPSRVVRALTDLTVGECDNVAPPRTRTHDLPLSSLSLFRLGYVPYSALPLTRGRRTGWWYTIKGGFGLAHEHGFPINVAPSRLEYYV
jgi:hypothetical protein